MKNSKKVFVSILGIGFATVFATAMVGCTGKNGDDLKILTIGEETVATDADNTNMNVNGSLNDEKESGEESKLSKLTPSIYADADFDTTGKVLFQTEHAVIDKEMESINYTIENLSGVELEYGQEYVLEIKSGEQWYQVPFPENYGWNAVAYVLPANNISGGIFNLAWMDFVYVDGEYRIVKKIGEYLVKAEFSMGESAITPETPFGYEALEELPLEYTIEDAIEDGVVVFGYQDSFNLERLKDFVVKAKLGLPTMVRIGFSTMEGDPIFYDLTRNVTEDGREWYTLYHDSRRDQFMYEENRVITKENFSYLVTDGVDIFFSNCAGYEESELFYESGISIAASAYLNQPDLIEEIVNRWEHLDSIELNAEAKLYREIIGLIEEMTKNRLEWNVTRYKSFSPEGTYYVSLNEEQINRAKEESLGEESPEKDGLNDAVKVVSFGFGTKGYGTSDYAITVKNMDLTKETTITGVEKVFWKDDETATLVYTTGTKDMYCHIEFYPKEAAAGNHEAAFAAFEEWEYVNNSDRQ